MIATRPLWWWDNSWCLPFTPPGKPEEGIRRERSQQSESGWMEQKGEWREQPWSKSAWKEKMRKTVRLNTTQYWGRWIGRSEGRRKIKGLDRQREERRNPPRSEMRIHAEPVFCGRSLRDRCTQSSILLYFVLCSVGAAELVRRFHWPNPPFISETFFFFFFRELNLIIPAEAWSQINMTCALVPYFAYE